MFRLVCAILGFVTVVGCGGTIETGTDGGSGGSSAAGSAGESGATGGAASSGGTDTGCQAPSAPPGEPMICQPSECYDASVESCVASCNDASSCTDDTCVAGVCQFTSIKEGQKCATNKFSVGTCSCGVCEDITE